jgi:hypothetical protein
VNHERWVEQDEEEEAEQQERLTKLKEEFQQEDLAKEEDDFSAEMFAIFRQVITTVNIPTPQHSSMHHRGHA